VKGVEATADPVILKRGKISAEFNTIFIHRKCKRTDWLFKLALAK